METTLQYLAQQQALEVLLHAQAYLQDFYENLGFEPIGPVFEEAGIPHVKMKKRLR
jgi:predicted GNAT family N-acyltransferase